MMSNLSKILWGILLIIIGVILGLNALELTNINIFFRGWWSLFIIIPCFIGLFDRTSKDKTANIVGLIIGIALLLAARNIISFTIIAKLILPFILIAAGISFIVNETTKSNITKKIKQTSEGELENIVATFAEQKVNKINEKFAGAKIDSVFGSVILDLREAKLNKETIIKASRIFAGIDIIIPDDVEVKIKATPIFGGISNKHINKEPKKIIYIDAFCMFGGIDIK